jgi:hypothetical protein
VGFKARVVIVKWLEIVFYVLIILFNNDREILKLRSRNYAMIMAHDIVSAKKFNKPVWPQTIADE